MTKIGFGGGLTFHAQKGAVTAENGVALIGGWRLVCRTAGHELQLHPLSFGLRTKGSHWIAIAQAAIQGLDICIAVSGNDNRKRLRFRVMVSAKRDVEVVLLAVELASRVKLASLLGANRRLVKSPRGSSVVWLERQGAYFGKGAASFFVQHVPNISSLSARGRMLRFSLLSSEDRPMPRRDDAQIVGYNLENPISLVSGQKLTARWNVYAGFLPREIVVPGFAPNGHRAVHVWTEHGCQTVLEAHIASGLGSSEVRRAEEAVGGFVKFRIPLTKTIFIDNEDGELVFDPFQRLGERPQLSLREDPRFADYLDILSSQPQVEIGLHCCRPYSTHPEEYPERLKDFQRYKPSVWIDHIWFRDDGTISGCREAASCEGRTHVSSYFSADILTSLGFRYFWSNGFEYRDARPTGTLLKNYLRHRRYVAAVRGLARWLLNRARGRIAAEPIPSIPDLPGKPWPLYWCERTKTGREAIYWTTASVNYPVVEGTRPVPPGSAVYGAASIDELIARESVCVTHAYPSSSHGRGSYWEECDGTFRSTPHFDALLGHMAQREEEGLLWNAKLSDAIAFWQRSENLRIDYADDGTARIHSIGEAIDDMTIKRYDMASNGHATRYQVISVPSGTFLTL